MAKAAKGLRGITQQEAIEKLNDAERPLYEDLKVFFDKKTDSDIWWHWKLGTRVAKIHQKTHDQEGTVYGEKLIFRLAKAMGMASDSSFYSAMHVVEIWPSEDDFGTLVKMRGTRDNGLSWTHVVLLSNVPDANIRLTLTAAALEQCWSSDQLYDEIKSRFGKREDRQGPTPRKPTSLGNCLNHMASSCNKMVSLMEKAWHGKNYNFQQAFRETPPDCIDQALVKKIAEAREVMDKLINKATEIYTALSEIEDTAESHASGAHRKTVESEDTFVDEVEENGQSSDDDDAIPMSRRRQQPRKKQQRKRQPVGIGIR